MNLILIDFQLECFKLKLMEKSLAKNQPSKIYLISSCIGSNRGIFCHAQVNEVTFTIVDVYD